MTSKRAAGFTLIEVMVAMAIGVVVIFLSYQSLHAAITSSEVTQENLAEIDDLSRAMHLLETDFRHAVNRNSQLFNVVTPTGFSSEDDNDYQLKFVRAGRANPAGLPRSSLLQVGYRWEEEILYRDSWPEAMDAARGEGSELELITGVTEFLVRFLPPGAENSEGPWSERWPPSGTNNAAALPIAVEVQVETERFGRITRLMLLGEG